MKKKLATLLLSIGLILSVNAAGTQIGFSVIDITPDMVHDIKPGKGILTHGYRRYSNTVRDKLFVRTVAMRDANGKTLVIVTADVCKFFPDFGISLMDDWFYKKYDRNKFGIIANSSHTHSAPYTTPKRNPYFAKQFRKACKDSIDAAINDLKDGSLKLAVLKTKGLSVNRRQKNPKTGQWKMAPDLDRTVDHDLGALLFYDAKGEIKAVLYSYACHATAITGHEHVISADYPGAVSRALKERFGQDVITLFAAGAGGDIKPPFYKYINWRDKKDPGDKKTYKLLRFCRIKPPELEAYGRKFADYIADGLKSGKFKDVNLELKMAYGRFNMPLKKGKTFPLYLGRYILDKNNKMQIVAMCGEVCHGFGAMIKDYYKKEGFETIFFGYSYHGGTYIPTDKIIREGGYEAKHLKFESKFSTDKFVMDKVKELQPK